MNNIFFTDRILLPGAVVSLALLASLSALADNLFPPSGMNTSTGISVPLIECPPRNKDGKLTYPNEQYVLHYSKTNGFTCDHIMIPASEYRPNGCVVSCDGFGGDSGDGGGG